MTDNGTSNHPKLAKSSRDRRHSPWPLVIVVALPVMSLIFGLPMWVILILLVMGTVLLFFSPHLAERRVRDPKKAWVQLMATFGRLQSAHAALTQTPNDAAARARFDKLYAECDLLLNSRTDAEWGADSGYVAKIRKGVADMSAPIPEKAEVPPPASGPEAARLEELKKQGPMLESEFQAFSGRLRALATDKACGMLETISGYQLQCRQGTMKEEDFHAAIRGLLERLDLGGTEVVPKPATPAQSGEPAVG